MPRVRVRGKMTEWGGAKPLCLFEIEKAGDWFGSGFTSSKTLQTHAGIELAEDVAAFIAKATKHEKINYRCMAILLTQPSPRGWGRSNSRIVFA